jgi:hypothetical protein
VVEIVEYKGIKFRRYSESENRSDRVYFTPGIADRQNGVKRLHEEIWMDEHGEIPEGYHVHHKDDNPLNNAPDNLDCIPHSVHLSNHSKGAEHLTSEKQLAHLAEVRPLTKEWHRSKEGKEWHVEHGKKTWRERAAELRTCDQCGEDFYTRDRKKSTRFCSNACKSAWRRDSGIDDEVRECAMCESVFEVNRYFKKKTRSPTCAANLRWKAQKERKKSVSTSGP